MWAIKFKSNSYLNQNEWNHSVKKETQLFLFVRPNSSNVNSYFCYPRTEKKEMKKRNEMKWNEMKRWSIWDTWWCNRGVANTRAFAEEKIISTHATYYRNPSKSPQRLATEFFEETHFILHLRWYKSWNL